MTTNESLAKPPTVLWWEHQGGKVHNALLVGGGSMPMLSEAWVYWLFAGRGDNGNWAIFAPRKLLNLPGELKAKLTGYRPAAHPKEQGLQVAWQDFDKHETGKIEHVSSGDPLFTEAFRASFKLFEKDLLNDITDKNPQQFQIIMSRLRITNRKVVLDVAPYGAAGGANKELTAKDVLAQVEDLRWGVKVGEDVVWCEKTPSWKAHKAISLQRETVTMAVGGSSASIANMPMASISWPLTIGEGKIACAVQGEGLAVRVPPKTSFKVLLGMDIYSPEWLGYPLPMKLYQEENGALDIAKIPRFFMELTTTTQAP